MIRFTALEICCRIAFTGSSSGTLAIVGVTVGLLGVGLLIAGWRLRRNN